MAFLDTEMMELGRKHPTNIHSTISLIRTLKYVLDILQTEEAFTVEKYKHTHTHTHTHTLSETVVYQGQVDKGEVLPRHHYKETRILLIKPSPKWKLN